MSVILQFPHKEAFRSWLETNGASGVGVWLLFGKSGGPATLSAAEALEEALCFGWIDGQMQSLDNVKYKKYFAPRTKRSNWSAKNKRLAEALIAQGRMASSGFAAIENAKKNGMWDAAAPPLVGDEQIEAFRQLVAPHEPAYANLMAMPMSVQKTYTGYYLDAKSPQTQQSRLEKIVGRLNQNLKPM